VHFAAIALFSKCALALAVSVYWLIQDLIKWLGSWRINQVD